MALEETKLLEQRCLETWGDSSLWQWDEETWQTPWIDTVHLLHSCSQSGVCGPNPGHSFCFEKWTVKDSRDEEKYIIKKM